MGIELILGVFGLVIVLAIVVLSLKAKRKAGDAERKGGPKGPPTVASG